MRILFVADVLPDPHAGAAGTELATIEALQALGHEVDAIWADALSHRIRHGNLHYLLELPGAFRRVIDEKCRVREYDVVHAGQPYAWRAARDHRRQRRRGVFVNRSHGWEPRIAAALRPWRRHYGVPEWRWPRGLAGRPMQWFLHSAYPRWCVQASDGVIVSCMEDKEFILRHYGVAAGRVACIPQAPAPVFTESAPAPLTDRRRNRILYVGQAAFFKAPQVLAEVFSRLAEGNPGLEFTWCCPEPAHAGCRALLGAAARARTTWIGWLPQEQLVRLYDDHGIFVFPSYTEGFGKVFLEAMARGLCVVASRAAGMRDVIRDGTSGCLVAPGDVDGFCRQVNHLLASGNMAAMGQAAAASAREYSWKRVADETVAFYQTLLSAKGEPGS